MKNLDHLFIEPIKKKWYQTVGIWYIENRFFLLIKKILIVKNNFLSRLIQKVARGSAHYKDQQSTFEKGLRLLKEGGDAYSTESEFGYSGDVFINELLAAHNYKTEIDDDFKDPSESKKLYDHVIETTTKLINNNKSKYYLNFGISYAYTDSILAKKFPNCRFFGIERTDSAKIYNERYFKHLNNLTSHSGDIFDFLSNKSFEDGIFNHSRTLLLLLNREFINKLYKSVYSAGFRYILLTEQFGISRQTKKPYNFSYDEDRESALYRSIMFTHNYPKLLKDNGFKVNRIEAIKTDHPHQDFRLLSIEAERIK